MKTSSCMTYTTTLAFSNGLIGTWSNHLVRKNRPPPMSVSPLLQYNGFWITWNGLPTMNASYFYWKRGADPMNGNSRNTAPRPRMRRVAVSHAGSVGGRSIDAFG